MKNRRIIALVLFIISFLATVAVTLLLIMNDSAYMGGHISLHEMYTSTIIAAMIAIVCSEVVAAFLLSRDAKWNICIEPFLLITLVGVTQLFPNSELMKMVYRFEWEGIIFVLPVLFSALLTSSVLLFFMGIFSDLRKTSLLGRLIFKGYQRGTVRSQLIRCILYGMVGTALIVVILVVLYHHLLVNQITKETFLMILCGVSNIFFFTSILALFLSKTSVGGDIEKTINESITAVTESQRDQVELITNMSHDLKTPMTVILGYAEQLEKEELPKSSQEIVKRLIHKCDYLNDLVNDVFELAKINSKPETPERCGLDLALLFEQVFSDYEVELEDFEICQMGMEQVRDVKVMCNGMHIQRVFRNLLDNVVKYANPTAPVRIVWDITPDHAIAFQIQNKLKNRLEIPAEDVLGRFKRGQFSRTGEGSGVGLAIVDSYVKANGGDVCASVKDDLFIIRISFRYEDDT